MDRTPIIRDAESDPAPLHGVGERIAVLASGASNGWGFRGHPAGDAGSGGSAPGPA